MPRPKAKTDGGRKDIRCAIYTRKSHTEGLDQDFNSLDAQREACEAYITSQKHEGWRAIPSLYDDGGISGATMDRPALQRLLADIRAGSVDVIVVYKVDRLTRALSDFAKIVEIFDERGVSFVSVTQQFNTTSSMGRLTLNMLLSFAQFEREVTGERIRDKIEASKKKGMWMGGVPPLGYACIDRKLVVIEDEAATVRHIFRRYAELGSVASLKDVLNATGIVSKVRINAAGRQSGGKPFARGALYHLLGNRIYLGEIVHKGNSYPGEHDAIVDQELWDRVEARLAANRVERQGGRTAQAPSLLAGLIFDDQGHRMTPTHAVKKGKRYRYYVSRPLIAGRRADAPAGRRVPAGEIEHLISGRLRQAFADQTFVLDPIRDHTSDLAEQKNLLEQSNEVAQAWPDLATADIRRMLLILVMRIDVRSERIDIRIRPKGIVQAIRRDEAAPLSKLDGAEQADAVTLRVPARLKRAGMETKMVVDGPQGNRQKQKPDRSLIRIIVHAMDFRDRVMKGRGHSIREIAEEAGVTRSYFTRVLRLTYLAPDIIQAILSGTQPPDLSAAKLTAASRLPLTWPEQSELLGFI